MLPLVSSEHVAQGDIGPASAGRLREMYMNSAANVDAAAGRLLEGVRAHLGREPAVIVTSDHGESLFDEGFLGHGYALDDVQTRVPLVVANLPVILPAVAGHTDLRWAVLAALTGQSGGGRARLVEAPGQRVFQYLGVVERPMAIGFASGTGRLVYDFRSRTIDDDGVRVAPGAAREGVAARWRALVNFWERVVLAERAAGNDGRDGTEAR